MTWTVEDCAIVLQAIAGHDPRDPGSLSHNEVHYLHEDAQGTLWVGTASGLNRMQREGILSLSRQEIVVLDLNALERVTYEYDPHLDPQLVWAGKAEHTSFEVDTVSQVLRSGYKSGDRVLRAAALRAGLTVAWQEVAGPRRR